MKKKKLEYYVFEMDMNTDEIKWFNIFDHSLIEKDIKKALKNKEIDTREKFKDELRKSFMYYYWSKCEHEVLVSPWPPARIYEGRLNAEGITIKKDWYSEGEDLQYECKNPEAFENIKGLDSGEFYLQNKEWDKHTKIDVYEQLKRNLDVITDLVLEHYGKTYGK